MEIFSIFLGLQTFAKDKTHNHTRIMTDNTTALTVINKMGTSHSEGCNDLGGGGEWEWCITKDIWISAAHTPGKMNMVAEFESRRNHREAEWKVDVRSLTRALQDLEFTPNIDLFASRINQQFVKYVSSKPDPQAVATDAFTLSWANLNFYVFPPFSVIPAMLSKIKRDQARGVCVLLDWPTQGWYALAMQMKEKEPIYLKARKDLLTLPATSKKPTYFIGNSTSW